MRRVVLLILDGAGYCEDSTGNAVTAEYLPTMFAAMERHGYAVLDAAAQAVGLEAGQVGNSEAGHLTIGAGRVVPSMTCRLARAYDDGSWAADPAWRDLADAGVLHVVGLLSDAGVHGLVRTMEHAARLASTAGVAEVVVHPVLDGVDSLAGSAPALLDGLMGRLADLSGVRFGVVMGRKAFCDRTGTLTDDAVRPLRGGVDLAPFSRDELKRHVAGASEMSFPPRLCEGGRTLRDGEPVLITNHRADRVRAVVDALGRTQPVYTIMDPGDGVTAPRKVFFPIEAVSDGLAAELIRAGVRSVRIAEKCKFPHVTFFLNGFDAGVEGEGCCVPSIAEHEIASRPEMSIREVTGAILNAIADPARRLVVANLCNLDQVGHLGRFDLATQAAHEVDGALGEILSAAAEHGCTVLVTADHGNADRVATSDGAPFGSHTDRPVPFFAVPAKGVTARLESTRGSLANVAATCLDAMGLAPPAHMEPPLARFVDA